eukprot:jgi/Undpi1/9975/HiC_scaffold_28.g12429.m1
MELPFQNLALRSTHPGHPITPPFHLHHRRRSMMKRCYLLASVTAGASLAGASTALCSGALSDGNGKSPPLKAVPLAGGASAKPAPSYTDRLVRLMHLVDPRHAFTTAEDVQRYRALVEESKAAQTHGLLDKDVQRAMGAVDACCNPASGEVIPAPFRLSGFLVCNVPIVATMLFSKSVYVQVISHWVNQSLNTAVNYYNRSGAEMTAQRVAMSYALAVGTACPLAFGLGKAFQRAPPSWRRFSFVASYVAVAAAGSLNVLFTRASEISGGVKVADETGEVRGVSKKAGLRCVLQTVASRGILLPIPVTVLPAMGIALLEARRMMPASPRAKMCVQVAVTTASLAIALPMSIAVFPQEATFASKSLEPEFHYLRLKDDSRKGVAFLYANKGL